MTAIAASEVLAAPTHTPVPDQLAALLEGTGVVVLDGIGWLRVTGEDRIRWLNGMTTNSIQALQPGECNYNFFLSAQGRIQGDAVALMLEDSILLGTARTRLPALTELLDRFIIMDDVELAEDSSLGLLVAGPEAASTLAAIGIPANDLAPLHFNAIDNWRGHKVAVIHAYSPLVPRFELWAESPETIAQLLDELLNAGATPCSSEAAEHLRILEGTPLYGTDIRDKELPQETNQTRALHFAKGCYLGQEIVERIRSRGNVHRVFHAFRLTGDLPAVGTALESDGKPVGELTSVASIPLASGPVQLALGYIRREALDRASKITYPGGEASPVATPYTAERTV
jgi:aminomethyltransferase